MQDAASANPLAALSDSLANLAAAAGAVAVGIRSHGRLVASGFVWKPGVVVTASDALEADDELSVLTASGNFPAQLAGRDPTTDIAVLRVGEGLPPPASASATGEARVGQLVVAAGRGKEGVVASMGLVSVAGGPWQSRRGGQIDSLIRLDLRLDPRAEGSLVVDTEGRRLGMAVFGPRQKPLVIPAATIERVAPKLLADGRIPRGYLGLSLHPIRLDEAIAASHSLHDRRAIMVVNVDPAGPAGKAGVLVGDVIVGFDGANIPGVRTLYSRLTPESVGKDAELKMVRAGQITVARVTIGASQTS
jgi:S1-C subfamily serine protease